MNIQDITPHTDVVKLTSFVSLGPKVNKEYHVYCKLSTGILYQVDSADGIIVGQKYILDIAFDKMPIDSLLFDDEDSVEEIQSRLIPSEFDDEED